VVATEEAVKEAVVLSRFRNHVPLAVAMLALFFAVGGPSFASDVAGRAAALITGKQVKDSSLTTKDVKNGSLLSRDFKAGQLLAGPQGPPGAKGDSGTQGAKGDTGVHGAKGDTGTAGSDAQFDGAAAGGDLTGAYPNPSIRSAEPWREVGAPGQPPFQNGWQNLDGWGTVAFYKDRNGIVHLRGLLNTTGHTGSQTVFYPPYSHGACDGQARIFTTQSGLGASRIDVLPSGAINPAVIAVAYAADSHLSLDGISYRTSC